MTTTTGPTAVAKGTGQYADVNGINLYYETHGSGRPLIGETMSKDFDFSDELRGLKVPTLIASADADMFPPSHSVEMFELLGGGQRDGGWMGEGRPDGGHALAIIPGMTHYDITTSPVLAAAALAFLDAPEA